MFAQTLAALYAFSCDAAGNPSPLQRVTATLLVIPFVSMQLGGAAPWPAFESHGSGMMCWRRLRPRQAAGVWQRLHMAMLEHFRQDDQIDWGRASIDGSSVPSPPGGHVLGC